MPDKAAERLARTMRRLQCLEQGLRFYYGRESDPGRASVLVECADSLAGLLNDSSCLMLRPGYARRYEND